MRAGPSHAYGRLLVGRLSPERYVEILKRTVDMRFAREDRPGASGVDNRVAPLPADELRRDA